MNKYHTIAILSQDADQLYCVEHQGLDVELFLMSCRLGVYSKLVSFKFKLIRAPQLLLNKLLACQRKS